MSAPRAAVAERVATPRFLLLSVSAFAYFAGLASTLPVLPRYLTDAGASEAEVGITVGVFGVTAVLLRPTVGRLVDRIGRRPVMIVGAVCNAALVALHAVSPAVPYLVVLRLLIGATEAGFFVGATTMVTDMAPAKRQGEAMSIFSVGVYLGLAAGPVLGEALYAAFGGGAFLGSAVLGLTAMTVVALGVPEPEGVIRAEAGAPRGEGWWVRLGVAPSAFLPGMILFGVIVGQAIFNAFVPLLSDEIGLDGAGVAYAVFGVGVIVVRLIGRTWPDRMPPRLAAAGAILFVAAGSTTIGLAPGLVVLLVGTAIMSVGQALAFPLMSVIAVRRARPERRGMAMSTMTAFVDLSFTVAPIMAGFVAEHVSLRAAFVAGAATTSLTLLLTRRLNPVPVGAGG